MGMWSAISYKPALFQRIAFDAGVRIARAAGPAKSAADLQLAKLKDPDAEVRITPAMHTWRCTFPTV